MIRKSALFKLSKTETSAISIQEKTILKKSEMCDPNNTVGKHKSDNSLRNLTEHQNSDNLGFSRFSFGVTAFQKNCNGF